jgi:energy-converting hydrogenase Eha subunit A
MSKILLKQSIYLPLAAMMVPIAISWFVPGYSSISQHLSELEMLNDPVALATRIAAIVSGTSIILFALGILSYSRRYAFSAVASAIFGLSMISNGVFVMGSPLHGLYGIGLISILSPAFFVADSFSIDIGVRTRFWLLLAAFLTLVYMWLMFAGLDPVPYRGLTQRVAVFVMFGWYSIASFTLLRRSEITQPAELQVSAAKG